MHGFTLTAVNDQRERGRGTVVLGALITAGAIALAAIHLARPKLRIDGVTLVLLLVAALPWLGSIFKAINLPGGWRFEYQQFKQVVQDQLSDVNSRVDRVEQYVFSGEVTDELRDSLTHALHELHEYFQGIGVPLSQDEPKVHIKRTEKTTEWLAYYESETNRIVISSQFANDPDLVQHEYSHHALMPLADCESGQWQWDALAIESGLATYFVCSHNDRPLLGRLSVSNLPSPGSWAQDLRNQRRITDVTEADGLSSYILAGLAWGGALWEVREILGREATDHLILGAWRGLKVCQDDGAAADFTAGLLGSLESDALRKVKSIFRRRGIVG